MNKKLFGKFNIFDVLFLVIVLCGAVVVGLMFFKPSASAAGGDLQNITLKLLVKETPDYVPPYIKEGDQIFDENKSSVIGTVKSFEVLPSEYQTVDTEGRLVRSTKDGYVRVEILCDTQGSRADNGFIISGNRYSVEHEFTFYAGRAKLFGTVVEIQK